MNTPLRDEIAQNLQYYHLTSFVTPEEAKKTIKELNGDASPETMAYVDRILSLIASKMPEKRSQDIDYGCQDCGAWEPWNACLDSVKSILKGGTE